MSTRSEAQKLFAQGRYHPACPDCGKYDLVIRARIGRLPHNHQVSYVCKNCRIGFTARIENDENT